jgi:alkanesulfonate monooxygenase SsuD/methylene tetrahydromethanopterin reductase-like flavin-dependent oxidoreductase (luciferase family)
VFDHLWPLNSPRQRPALECWTLLAALAAHAGARPGGTAGGFRLGTLVTRAGLRPPALVARMAAGVGALAGAPPLVGVGGGDAGNRAENLAYGLPFRGPDGRLTEVERTVAALRGPLAGHPPPEVWVAGLGPRARAVAGRVADTWNAWALSPNELAEGLADVRRAASLAGRDPATVAATWGGQALVAATAEQAAARLAAWSQGRSPSETGRVVAGDADVVLGRLAELRAAGATWCVLSLVGGPAGEMRELLAAGWQSKRFDGPRRLGHNKT